MAKQSLTYEIPIEVSRITESLQKAGFEAYLVGGCVRDAFRAVKPKDWDIATNALPEEVVAVFPHTFYENEFGTVGVVQDDVSDETLRTIEITTYRLEAEYKDKRRPSVVKFSKNIEDDLKRRDFTINAMAVSLPEGERDIYKGQILDPFKGQEDLTAKIIRTVGDPEERFNEDALRILRAVRLASELGFTINLETAQSIEKDAELLNNISKERIRDEFNRILMSGDPGLGIVLSHKLGVLKQFLPEIEEGIGIDQNQAHKYDVWEHNLRSMQHAAEKDWDLTIRLAALFHDVGKPKARRWSEEKGDWTFHGHEVVGAKMTKKIMKNLRYSSEMIDDVTTLVRWHMFFSDPDKITLSAVRRMIRNVGPDRIWGLMNLRICDRIGTGRPKEEPYRFRKYQAMIEEASRDPVSVGMLKIDGNKLIGLLKINPGPKIGHILHALLEEVLEDPKLNTEKYLEKRAVELSGMKNEDLEELAKAGKNKKEIEEEREVKKIRGRFGVE